MKFLKRLSILVWGPLVLISAILWLFSFFFVWVPLAFITWLIRGKETFGDMVDWYMIDLPDNVCSWIDDHFGNGDW